MSSKRADGPFEQTYLVDFGPLAGKAVPQDDRALIVAARQQVLVIAAPADTAATDKDTVDSLQESNTPLPTDHSALVWTSRLWLMDVLTNMSVCPGGLHTSAVCFSSRQGLTGTGVHSLRLAWLRRRSEMLPARGNACIHDLLRWELIILHT